ncbi:putative streptomycin phosphotransferase [Actinocatenispora thailandica]|uniref:Putative streptomycin phosphotransferase n=1 Tax=Actinocatenispora thailandica TaxID=227318 RepID=A0A7R7DTJ2_9ACTN|nr:APH(3') family aminoglycoside O-phosphotransferase [Actinocatenispora thailandica]BCJ37569.1 putative streptomycin phosphotransferase [Actinocatenispora thailandica]
MWEPVTVGMSGAVVERRGGVYRKRSTDPRHDLVGEGERLRWLREQGFPAAEVLDCRPGLLVTAALPGRSAAEHWPAAARPSIVAGLADLTRALHGLPIAACPFDRRLAVAVPEALAAGVEPTALGEERTGWSRDRLAAELLATRPDDEDPVVCHGDLCLPNVLFDPDSYRPTGVIDVGRLGVADRWCDLALATRSLTAANLNPQYGPWAAAAFLDRYGIPVDPDRIAFYRLLDEFA